MRSLLSLIALTSLAAPAFAETQPAEDIVTVRIETAGLNLNTSEGRAQIEARIDKQLEAACTISNASRYNYGRPVIDETCIAEGRAKALAQVARIAAAKQQGAERASAN